jgi:hypothetical protein
MEWCGCRVWNSGVVPGSQLRKVVWVKSTCLNEYPDLTGRESVRVLGIPFVHFVDIGPSVDVDVNGDCGVPIEKVAKNVNTSIQVIREHYDVPTFFEDLEERRRDYVGLLRFADEEENVE